MWCSLALYSQALGHYVMQLRWKASFSASCLHAAASMLEGLPVVDTAVAAILQQHVSTLAEELCRSEFAVESTMQLLVGLAADYENNRQLVEMAAKRTQGSGVLSDAAITRLTGCIGDLEAAWRREQPNLVEELVVRQRPLREQWESRGPGLLKTVARLTEDNLIADSAEIVLVTPFVGGHGRAHLRSNRVTLEAVLTHPNPDLPETLRLGWLLAQLNLDLPTLSESVSGAQLAKLASAATLPAILAAAEQVDLAQLDEPTVQRALASWHFAPTLPTDTATRLLDWWSTYVNGNVRWPVALAALGYMLDG